MITDTNFEQGNMKAILDLGKYRTGSVYIELLEGDREIWINTDFNSVDMTIEQANDLISTLIRATQAASRGRDL